MNKKFCDICGREIPQYKFVIDDGSIGQTEVIIHHKGRTLDICDACCSKIIGYAFKDSMEREE